jgi:hypothetical protein
LTSVRQVSGGQSGAAYVCCGSRAAVPSPSCPALQRTSPRRPGSARHADVTPTFDHLERTPEFFRDFLNSYLVDAPQGWRAALERTRASVFNDQNFQATWRQLLPADKSVLRLLADGTATLQAEATRKRLGTELGVPVVSPATVQNALARLVQQSLLTKVAYGRYAFVDEAFADWVLHVELGLTRGSD